MTDKTDKTYPVAEIFTSPQGEGYWTGTLMAFVRLAGCSVGKPYLAAERKTLGLNVYQERCTTWDGRSFPCDTNYRKTRQMSVDEILHEVGDLPRICLTGGEPLMHDVIPLIDKAEDLGKRVHIETSGTVCLGDQDSLLGSWIAVSPKKSYLPDMVDRADELRFLIGRDFDEEAFVKEFGGHFIDVMEFLPPNVFISPINHEHSFDADNAKRCIELQRKYPALRISTQTHKILQCR